jgi:choline dehydrogenase-like flavoprotein
MSPALNREFDAVVIGSGIAGALAADRLSKAGATVVILEAGPRFDRAAIFDKTISSVSDDPSVGYPDPPAARRGGGPNDGEIIRFEGESDYEITYLRGVGGTTWHWSGCCPRLLPSDMALRSQYGRGLDWPLSYEAIEQYYCEAEAEIGISGDSSADLEPPRTKPYPLPPMPLSYFDRAVASVMAPYGISFEPLPQPRSIVDYGERKACEGHNFCTPICPIGAQYSAAIHIERAERRGVVVSADTVVISLSAAAGGRIAWANCRHADGATGSIGGKVFVLAANGLESPRLLLASRNESYPHGLANTSGAVGRYLMGHTHDFFTLRMAQPVYGGRGPLALSVSNNFRDGPFRRESAGGIVLLDNNLIPVVIADELLKQGIPPPELDRRIRDEATRRLKLIFIGEELAEPENRVSLDWSKRDGSGIPTMVVRYHRNEYSDRGGNAVAAALGPMFADGIAQLIQRRVQSVGSHLMGTLRMGRDTRSSVVDPDGRSHDHPNLFVAGSSVFPSGGTCNPTLTIAALSLRTADSIVQQLSDGN